MSISGDVRAAIEREEVRLARLTSDFKQQEAQIRKKIAELKQAQALITPQIDMIAEKLGLVVKPQ